MLTRACVRPQVGSYTGGYRKKLMLLLQAGQETVELRQLIIHEAFAAMHSLVKIEHKGCSRSTLSSDESLESICQMSARCCSPPELLNGRRLETPPTATNDCVNFSWEIKYLLVSFLVIFVLNMLWCTMYGCQCDVTWPCLGLVSSSFRADNIKSVGNNYGLFYIYMCVFRKEA